MTYASTISRSFGEVPGNLTALPLVSREVIEQSLDFKHRLLSEAFDVSTDGMTYADGRLFRSRIIGGSLARTATASHVLVATGDAREGFFDLPEDDQGNIIDETIHYFEGHRDAASQDQSPVIPHALVRSQLHRLKKQEVVWSHRMKDILAYINVSPDSYEVRDRSISQPDTLLVQAFGRNAIKDSELYRIRDARIMRDSDLAMMKYLDEEAFDPGESNRQLAEIVAQKLNPQQVVEPIIQWEVAYALWQKDPERFEEYQHYLHPLWPKSNFYPTYQVKADSLEVMDKLGLYNPLELAHQDMMVRAMGILAKLGIEADAMEADIPYDPRSTQMQTRGITPWMIRETLTRLEHVVRQRVSY